MTERENRRPMSMGGREEDEGGCVGDWSAGLVSVGGV
jgi:hypothetical protein